MEMERAIDAFAALAQPTRLRAFRLLVEHIPDGLPAGEIARLVDVPQNTMSTHLAVLGRAGLVSADRDGRSITYRAELGQVRDVAAYLVNDCCGGRPELCEPLAQDFTKTTHGKGACSAC
ncbi:MAG TPA: metalloregulator ArsR/SmtB family transcription factor [Devosia sp.]|nr:metalloregulator ArsR/SmtB family transcription factor [Devosia sp.]